MKKSLDEYMNDPEIVNEPSPTLREIYAIRLKIYDETKDMTAAEHTRWSNERAQRLAAQYGFKIGKPRELKTNSG